MREESFAVTRARSDDLWTQIHADPRPFRGLTGDRATGVLHVGHFFGSLENRLRLQTLGVGLNVVIADYQALTDREASAHIEHFVLGIALDYLAAGLDPNNERTMIFVHSCVASLNQLFLPFLSLVAQPTRFRCQPTRPPRASSSRRRTPNARSRTNPSAGQRSRTWCSLRRSAWGGRPSA